MGKIKNERIYLDFAMVSFDVKSLFTSVSLTKTIDIILDRVYNRKKKTVLTKNKIKKLVSLVSTYISHWIMKSMYEMMELLWATL